MQIGTDAITLNLLQIVYEEDTTGASYMILISIFALTSIKQIMEVLKNGVIFTKTEHQIQCPSISTSPQIK